MAEKEWEQNDLDVALNILFSDPSIGKERFELLCSRVGREFDRSMKSIRTLVWKLAAGYGKYASYESGPLRIGRNGLPMSWLDEYVIKMARQKDTVATKMRIASILCRNIFEVNEYLHKRKSKGRKGFGIT